MLFETNNKSQALKTSTVLLATIALVGCANANANEKSQNDKIKESKTAQTETWQADEALAQNEETLGELLDDAYTVPVYEQDEIVGKVYFDFDSSQLDNDDKEALDLIATWLEQHPTQGLVVAGHADQQGPHHYNMTLALKRAEVAKAYLVSKGVDEERLMSVSHGEADIEVLGYTPTAHRLNRRVTFKTDPANAYGVNLDYKPDTTQFASKEAQ
ncbi:MAG: OmpA family protein [Myxococcota bacterium]|nr:OmpA family protein [Myxococcota bacterium]